MKKTHSPLEVKDYRINSELGKGSFGVVFKATHKLTGKEVAIKIQSRNANIEESEISLLKEIKHKNVIGLIEVFMDKDNCYIVLEYCSNGSLRNFIKTYYNGRVPELQAQKIIQQITEGYKALIDKKIIHRDLKFDNILVDQQFDLKIADFGFARRFENEDSIITSLVGSPIIMDPLILEKQKYKINCDIWSLGVIFYQILTGTYPFVPPSGKKEDLAPWIRKQKVAKFPPEIPLSDSVKDLINKMLNVDNEKRISAQELFEHEWITGIYSHPEAKKDELASSTAAQLLESVYKQKMSQGIKEIQGKVEDKVVKEEEQKTDSKEATKNIEKESLQVIAFFTKSYEMIRVKLSTLRKFIIKQKKNIGLSAPLSGELHSLLCLVLTDLLQIIKEYFTLSFEIFIGDGKPISLTISLEELLKKISANQKEMTVLNCLSPKEDVLELIRQLSKDSRPIYEMWKQCTNVQSFPPAELKKKELDKSLFELLIQSIEEVSSEEENLLEKSEPRFKLNKDQLRLEEEKLEKRGNCLKICPVVCEYLIERNQIKKPIFEVKIPKEQGNKYFLLDYLSSSSTEDCILNFLTDQNQIEAYQNKLQLTKNTMIISEKDSQQEFSDQELAKVLKRTQCLLNQKSEDLFSSQAVFTQT